MAPRSRLMTCRVRTTADSIAENQVWAAEQFCVAPPLDPTNHAQLITMSLGWEYAWTPRLGMWRQSTTNVATAGLPFQIAAGNERGGPPVPYNLRVPGSCPGPWHHPAEAAGGRSGAITIGATDNADAIASFSSQGPVAWDTVAGYNDYPYPPGLLKPDVSAPGVNITSCDYQNNSGYLSGWSGTSMATPCAAGVVALMLNKNPTLLPAQVDSILQYSVRPLGSQPKNNDFGTGRISAYLALLHTPLPGPRHDVAIQSIQTPGAKVDPLVAIAPVVRVQNSGTYRETNVPVRFRVDSAGVNVYNNLQTIPTLDSAATVNVTFANWTPGPGGNTYNLTTYHTYSPDTNRLNDTLRAVTQTRVHDVRSISSSIGSRVRALSPISPQLTLGNPGDYTERTFNATCWIDSGATRIYTQTVPVDSVVANGTKTVSFPVWNTGPVGATYNLTFFNSFSDPNHGNDTLRVATQASNAIRVAIENASASRGRTPPNAVYQIDSLCQANAWVDSIVTGTSIDSPSELANYDVVVTGDVGYNDNDFTVYQRSLLDWVRGGHGAVILGWGIYGIQNGPHSYSPMDTVCALMASGGYAFTSSGMVHVTDTTHPITRGVGDFSIITDGESGYAGLWTGAVSLGNYSAQPTWSSIAYKYLGTGRSVYLGPIYFADFQSYNNLGYFTGANSRLLLKQAIEWAAMGSVSGAEVLPPIGTMPRIFALASARPNPLRGTTEICYQLPTSGPVRITVFNVAGQVVKTLVNGKEDAGYKSVTWNGRNDRGTQVGAGVYLYRMEAGSFTATQKMVVVR
jgi:hypothetical protein